MTAALRTFAEALREEGNRVEDIRAAREGDVGTGEFGRIFLEAISNILPAVKP
jgi:deoxyribodipyrimidine photolyase-like uncharacterized protein